MAGGPVERQRTAPVMADEHDAVQPHRREPLVKVTGVVVEPVRDVWFAG